MRTTLACCAALLVSGQATAQVAECAAEWGLDSITTLMVEEMIQARLPEVQAQRAAGGGGPIFRIPVVFHIIHMGAGTPSNIPDLQVLDQLDHLNDEFRDNLDGFGDIPQIEFCLAQNTWDGQPWSAYNAVTPGITRWEDPIASAGNTMTVAEMFELVNVVQFPPDNYFNVWIVNEVGGDGVGGVGGYATFPTAQAPLDGVVIESAWITAPPFIQGDLLIHETGHYLSLFHVFGNCLGANDQCLDTPPSPAPNLTATVGAPCQDNDGDCGVPEALDN